MEQYLQQPDVAPGSEYAKKMHLWPGMHYRGNLECPQTPRGILPLPLRGEQRGSRKDSGRRGKREKKERSEREG